MTDRFEKRTQTEKKRRDRRPLKNRMVETTDPVVPIQAVCKDLRGIAKKQEQKRRHAEKHKKCSTVREFKSKRKGIWKDTRNVQW